MQRQVIGNRILLQFRVGHQQHGQRGRRHGDLVGAHGRFGEVGKRGGQVVPLDEVADHGGGVLNAVRPFHRGDALGGVDDIADDHVDGSAVAPGVVNGHGGVLEPHGAVREYGDGLAFDLRVPVSHGHGGLFVAAGDEFGTFVPAIVDHRFVQAAEARSGIRADVLDAQRLDDVDHEIGAGAAFREDFEPGGRADLRFRWNRRGRRNARRVARASICCAREAAGLAAITAAPTAALFRKLRRSTGRGDFRASGESFLDLRMGHLADGGRARKDVPLYITSMGMER